MSIRPHADFVRVGYDLRDFDDAVPYTWKYLRDANVRELQAVHESVLEGTTSTSRRAFSSR